MPTFDPPVLLQNEGPGSDEAHLAADDVDQLWQLIDVEPPDEPAHQHFHLIQRTLRAAGRHNTVLPGGRRPIWATEIWWESNPPDRAEGVRPKKHARWLRNAVRSLRKQGAKVVLNYLLRDQNTSRANRFDTTASGIFFRGGKKKPAFRAWRRLSR